MMFRIIILLLVLSPALPLIGGERPNVLFLVVDDMNDWVGCMQSEPRAITPNLDRLAKRGVLFTNAHTAGVFCAPSRAAIFSGQYASTTGCYRTANYFVHRPEIESLQTSFSKAGYKTFGAGKLYHHPAGAIDIRDWDQFFLRTPEQRGLGWALDSWSEGTPFPHPFPHSPYNKGTEITGGLFLEWGALPDDREDEMADTQRIDWAVERLKEVHEQPFFLGVGLYAPHYPNYCPEKYFDLYRQDDLKRPQIKPDDLEDLPPKIRKIKEARSRIHQKLEDLNAVEDAIHGYLACMSYADAMMGRVLDALEASPYADNTLVVLWSDHGFHHGQKGDWGKHTLWERTSNVPLIVAGPEVAKGSQCGATVSLIDLYPTLVDMCRLPQPFQKLEGVSLRSHLENPTEAPDRNVFLPHMNRGEYAIMNREWRYICYGEDGEELYDVQNDPNEWTNLAAESQSQSTMELMRRSAPQTFAVEEPKLNVRRDLWVDQRSFEWRSGEGNYQPPPKYLPYTQTPLQGKNNAGLTDQPTGNPVSVRRSPNVLLIICDDLNTHVSPSGYAEILTPTLTAFAAESQTFRRAYCQYPVCGPSRASFLTGLYPESTGVLDNMQDMRTTRPATVTLPQFFKERGYWTGGVGKVFHSPRHDPGGTVWSVSKRYENDELPVVQQARKNFESEFGSIELPANRKNWKEAKRLVLDPLNAQTPPGHGPSGLRDEQHKDGKNARQVARWLVEGASGKQPFFIACGIQKPHVPFLAPEKYFDLYPKNEILLTENRPGLWKSIPEQALSKRYSAFGFEAARENPDLRREYIQAYHACISFVDAQIKLIFDALRESGHWDDTVVIFTSDHGYHLGEHYQWGKVTLFDIGTRVPFMVRVPGMTKPGTYSEAMVELVDIFPTLVDLCGFEPPEDTQGMSLRPLLGHPDRLGKKKYAYTVVRRGQKLGYAIRSQRWRYSQWPQGEELYNLTNDPEEQRNLAGKSHVETRLVEMRQILDAKRKVAGTIQTIE